MPMKKEDLLSLIKKLEKIEYARSPVDRNGNPKPIIDTRRPITMMDLHSI